LHLYCCGAALQLDVGNIELLQRKQVVRELVHRMGPRQLLLKDKLTFVLGSTCLWYAQTATGRLQHAGPGVMILMSVRHSLPAGCVRSGLGTTLTPSISCTQPWG
jgi:hypothetical protein